MDMGYDHNRVYAECAERDCAGDPAPQGPEKEAAFASREAPRNGAASAVAAPPSSANSDG
jgi:hypothetical protein